MIIDRARELRKQSTDAERKLWFYLRARRFKEFKIRRQVPIAGFFADFTYHAVLLGTHHPSPDRPHAVRSDVRPLPQGER